MFFSLVLKKKEALANSNEFVQKNVSFLEWVCTDFLIYLRNDFIHIECLRNMISAVSYCPANKTLCLFKQNIKIQKSRLI